MKKRTNLIRTLLVLIFALAMMLSMVSCTSKPAAEEPDVAGTDPPVESMTPGAVATAKPSATVQPGTPVKITTGESTTKPSAASGNVSTAKKPDAATQPSTAPAPSTTRQPEQTKTPEPTQKPSMPAPTPTPTPVPTPFTPPATEKPTPTQGPVKQPDPTPTPHVHEWEAVTEEVKVVDQPATEGHFEGGTYTVLVCRCGAEFTSGDALDAHQQSYSVEDQMAYHAGSTVSSRSDQNWVEGTAEVSHLETRVTGYKCLCGATKGA